MKILVLGATGMLGSMVYRRMQDFYGVENVYGTGRNENKLKKLEGNMMSMPSMEHWAWELDWPISFDYVINCIGVIKQVIDEFNSDSVEEAIRINSIFPRRLADKCNLMGTRLIHISTDCVFSGQGDDYYTENRNPDPVDVYGRSKLLGECPDYCMVLRTSIIGEELDSQNGLLEWVKTQAGQVINGYTNHWWNGMTTLQLAEILHLIIEEDAWEKGIFHLGMDESISKYELIKIIVDVYNVDVKVKQAVCSDSIDRTLETVKCLLSKLSTYLPDIESQLREMVDYTKSKVL